MTGRAWFHRLASEELAEAVNFYELESTGLGAAFVAAVDRSLTQLGLYPESAPVIRGRLRKKSISGFPYSLLYSVVEAEIRILAVMHERRRPFYWRGRR